MLTINPATSKIVLTKGDDASLYLAVSYVDGEEYKLKDDDSICMTVRKNANDEDVAIYVEGHGDYFTFKPEDTKQLEPGLYVYDVQLTTGAGKIYTVVPTSVFELIQEVSR